MPFLREKSLKIFSWLRVHGRTIGFGCLAFIAVSAILVPHAVRAIPDVIDKAITAHNSIGAIVLLLLANLLQTIVFVLGAIMLGLVWILIQVAQYNGFVNAPVVQNGWTIVRDVTNMFFILVLLMIAFGTMLGVEKYSYKNKRLSGLLIMAIVVNFTRTICGVLIDFGQVVMLTFVYGFREAAGGNFANAFHIVDLLNPSGKAMADTVAAIKTSSPLSTALDTVISLVLALIAIALACGILIVFTISLVIRIVYLWLLIVMSPLAFFMRAVPSSAASSTPAPAAA